MNTLMNDRQAHYVGSRTYAPAPPPPPDDRNGSRTYRAQRNDPLHQTPRSEGSQDARSRKDSDRLDPAKQPLLDRYPQYIGRAAMGIVVMVKDSFGFVKCAFPVQPMQPFSSATALHE